MPFAGCNCAVVKLCVCAIDLTLAYSHPRVNTCGSTSGQHSFLYIIWVLHSDWSRGGVDSFSRTAALKVVQLQITGLL